MDEVKYAVKYGPENFLNPYGDYDQLVFQAVRDDKGAIKKTWRLVSSKGFPDYVLDDKNSRNALEVFFIQQAVTLPKEPNVGRN